MSTYEVVMKNVNKHHQKMKDDGIPISEQYARLTGMLEINVVTLLDYVAIHCGEDRFDEALSRISFEK